MKESGIAVAFEKLGEIITELERDNTFMRYRIEDCEKQIAEQSKDNALLRAENELLHKQLDDVRAAKVGELEAAAEMRCSNG